MIDLFEVDVVRGNDVILHGASVDYIDQLRRQLVDRVLDDDHPGPAKVDVNRDRPVPVGMV